LSRVLAAALVLASFLALQWAGPLADGVPPAVPTLREWAALQPRQYTADGREIPFSGTPYFELYHPQLYKQWPGQGARGTGHGTTTVPSPSLAPCPLTLAPSLAEGGGSARWAPVLRVSGVHCNLYVDSAASPQPNDTVCINLTDQFDTVIWPVDTEVFGTPGFPVTDIYIYPIDGPGGVGGYYSGGNDLYADSDDLSWMLEILAHEFQHLIHSSKDSNENSWVNEGCADLAIQLCYGFFDNTTSLNSHINYFEANTDNDLTVFQNQLYDYGSSYAFLSYFHEHFGGNATVKALVADPANGVQGFSNRLVGTGETFASVFRNWTVANYLNNGSIAPAFGYSNLSIKVQGIPVSAYPFSRNTTVNRWAADYHIFLAEGADLELAFDGSDTVPFEVVLGKVGIDPVPSSVERLAQDAGKSGNITVPRLGMDYSEVVMITSATTSGGSYCFTADAVDRTPPVTTLVVDPPRPDFADGWYNRSPSLSLSSSERRSGIFYRWDDGTDAEYAGALTAPEGEHVFRFHSVDPAGNIEAEQAVTVRVDTTPPVTELSVAPPDGRAGWYVTAPAITLSTEGGAATRYTWEGGPETAYDGPFPVPEGESLLAFHSVDRHGNIERGRTASFRVDTRAPASGIVTDPAMPDGDNGWFRSPPVIRLDTEPGSELHFGWNSESESPYVLPVVAREGRNDFFWYARDSAGNREPLRQLELRVDTVAPVCSVRPEPAEPDGNNGYYRTAPLVALSTDPDATAVYRWGSGRWENFSEPLRAPEGVSTLYYYAVDRAGNRAQEQYLDLSVDSVPPVTTLSLVPDLEDGWYGEAPAAGLSSERGARTFWGIDDGEARQYSGRVVLPEGRHTLWYFSTDEAGNEEGRRSRAYALDLTGPAAALAAGNLTPLEGQNVTFDGSGSSDNGSGLAGFRFIFGDGTETGWVDGPVVTHAFARAGVYNVSLTARDAVGREGGPVLLAINVSAPPPPGRPTPPDPTLSERLGPALPALVVILVAVAVAAAYLGLRRRGGGE